MRTRLLPVSLCAVALFFLSGCGSLRFSLPGHSAQAHTAAVTLHVGEQRLALETPRRLPAPGGFEFGLASEDAAIVAVERVAGPGGSASYTLTARQPGTVTVHYVNRYTFGHEAARGTDEQRDLRAVSLGGFTVTVAP